jgi:hypothetical protein
VTGVAGSCAMHAGYVGRHRHEKGLVPSVRVGSASWPLADEGTQGAATSWQQQLARG